MMASVDLVSSQSVGYIRIVFCLLLLETLFVFFSFLSLYKKMMVAWFHSFLSSGCSKKSSRLFPYSIDPPFSLFYFLTHSQLEIFTQLRPAQLSSNQPTPLGPWFFFILAFALAVRCLHLRVVSLGPCLLIRCSPLHAPLAFAFAFADLMRWFLFFF